MLNLRLQREGNYFELLKRPEWKAKRKIIIARDNKCCTKCGNTKNLHVHHKYYLPDAWPWEYPDEALVTLCRTCHQKVHNKLDLRRGKKPSKKKLDSKPVKKHKPPVTPKSIKFDRKQEFLKRRKGKPTFAETTAATRAARRKESAAYSLPEYQHLKDK